MASDDCSTKKLKLSNSSGKMSTSLSNRISGTENPSIVHPEMAFYCFDVVYCQLNQLDPPKAPNFSNEPL